MMWSDRTNFKTLQSIYKERWQMLFDMRELGDLSKPLKPKVLSDPNHKVTRHLLYLYSMETFIYPELNRASREKDKSKIKFYGAYAAALSHIIQSANSNRHLDGDRLRGTTVLYRGLSLGRNQLQALYKPGDTIHLIGYTSTSLSAKVALNFAMSSFRRSGSADDVPVLFDIHFHEQRGLFKLSTGYSAYAAEEEVLV